jgi:hypothetical protein
MPITNLDTTLGAEDLTVDSGGTLYIENDGFAVRAAL